MKPWVAKIAIRTARQSLYPRFRHGAVLESGGKILSKGVNARKTYTPEMAFYVHAEVAALKRYETASVRKRAIEKVSLYVARINPEGKVMLSCPCQKCMKKIVDSGLVSDVYFSTSEGWGHIVLP